MCQTHNIQTVYPKWYSTLFHQNLIYCTQAYSLHLQYFFYTSSWWRVTWYLGTFLLVMDRKYGELFFYCYTRSVNLQCRHTCLLQTSPYIYAVNIRRVKQTAHTGYRFRAITCTSILTRVTIKTYIHHQTMVINLISTLQEVHPRWINSIGPE